MEIQPIIDAIYQSNVSTAIRDTSWVVPVVQSIHIVAIATLVGSMLVTDLRLAGVFAVDEAPRIVAMRYMRWVWAALVVLLVTGAVMAIGEPDRVLNNWIFWLKMGLVLCATALSSLFRLPLLRPDLDESNAWWSRADAPFAWISLAIWVCVIFCGRWIAYAL